MITATNTRAITVLKIEEEKMKAGQQILEWCESTEDNIVKEASTGVWCVDLVLPTLNRFISSEDRENIIKEFFDCYGYETKFYNSTVRIGWWKH